MTQRARGLARRVLARAARPALHGPGSPVQGLTDRVDAIEQSLADLWRISEEMREAIGQMRNALDDQLPDLVEDIDRRIAHHDEARAAEIQGIEALRQRIQALEGHRAG